MPHTQCRKTTRPNNDGKDGWRGKERREGRKSIAWTIMKRVENIVNPHNCISNNPNFRLKHLGVPDGSDGFDGTSYALMENDMLPVA